MFLQFCLVTCLQYTIIFINIQVNFVFFTGKFFVRGKKKEMFRVW